MKPNEGFAKLKGYDVEFYLQKLTATLGRTTPEHKSLFSDRDHSSTTPVAITTKQRRQQAGNDTPLVDIPLGEYRNVSRLHAKIQFNFRKKSFELVPLGRNGVRINGRYYAKGSDPVPLTNGTEVQMGDAFFVFLLPKTPTTVKRIVSVAGSDVAEPFRFQEGQQTGALVAGTLGPAIRMGKDGAILSPAGRSNLMVDRNTQQVYEKPTESYAVIISRMLLEQPSKQLTLQQIYQNIQELYPYFQTSEVGWKSSVRHALSTNKFFKRVPLDIGGKRAVYAIDEDFSDQLRDMQEAAARRKRDREQRRLAQEAKKRKAQQKEEREGKKQKTDQISQQKLRQQQLMQFQQQQQQMITHFTQYAQQLHNLGLDQQTLQQYQLQFMAQPEQTLQHMLHHILHAQKQQPPQQQQHEGDSFTGGYGGGTFGDQSALDDVVHSLQQQINAPVQSSSSSPNAEASSGSNADQVAPSNDETSS